MTKLITQQLACLSVEYQGFSSHIYIPASSCAAYANQILEEEFENPILYRYIVQRLSYQLIKAFAKRGVQLNLIKIDLSDSFLPKTVYSLEISLTEKKNSFLCQLLFTNIQFKSMIDRAFYQIKLPKYIGSLLQFSYPYKDMVFEFKSSEFIQEYQLDGVFQLKINYNGQQLLIYIQGEYLPFIMELVGFEGARESHYLPILNSFISLFSNNTNLPLELISLKYITNLNASLLRCELTCGGFSFAGFLVAKEVTMWQTFIPKVMIANNDAQLIQLPDETIFNFPLELGMVCLSEQQLNNLQLGDVILLDQFYGESMQDPQELIINLGKVFCQAKLNLGDLEIKSDLYRFRD